MRTLPELVVKITSSFDAWIVGSAADPSNKDPRDYDIQVPFSQWGKASLLIPKNAKVNTFGGFKCISEGKEVDIWPGELGWIMARPMSIWVWHPASGIRYRKV